MKPLILAKPIIPIKRASKELTVALINAGILEVTEDGLKSQKLLKDILKNVEEYSVKFHEILSMKDKVTLFFFKRILMKEYEKVNWNKVSNYLATLSGRLSKKEEPKNG